MERSELYIHKRCGQDTDTRGERRTGREEIDPFRVYLKHTREFFQGEEYTLGLLMDTYLANRVIGINQRITSIITMMMTTMTPSRRSRRPRG